MGVLKLHNWVDFKDLTGIDSNIQILIDKELISECIAWTDDHYAANSSATIADRYQQNKKMAEEQRKEIFTEHLLNTLEEARQSAAKPPIIYYFKAMGTHGQINRIIYINIVEVPNQKSYMLVSAQLDPLNN